MKKYLLAAGAALAAFYSFAAFAEGNNGVAATVNGANITVAEIKKAYDNNPQVNGQMKFEDFYSRSLDMFVGAKLISQAAVKDKISESKEYKTQLALATDELARKIYLEEKVKAQVTDKALKAAYDDYKKNFKPEPEVKAKHILVDSTAKAKEVIAKLKKGGKFDDLAKEYSREPADLGWFAKAMMVPEFGSAAFALKKGEYSQVPVKTQYGYHVILVEDARTSKPVDYKAAEPQLRQLLSQKAVGDTLDKLAKQGKVAKYGLDGKEVK